MLLSLFFTSHIYAIEPQQPQQLLSPDETLSVLEKIKSYAIVFGEGKREVHVFIDPYCSVSQHYLSTLLKSPEQRFKKSTYYFYLYELKSEDSKEAIQTILGADNKKEMLKAVMVDEDIFFMDEEHDVEAQINEITKAAQQIGVYKRPYIIIDGKSQ